ncbi:MAG: hydantoinase B/oxoprolinase family protein [Chloroflexi bacterium]|nr:hydantoinase B/oxoprolinase family protein [Chloroflexota bacterium]
MVKYKADAVTMQVVRYGLEAICDDMAFALQRMGRSTVVKEILDFNCAVLDHQGEVLAQAHLSPLFMFSLPGTCQNMLKHYADTPWQEGDVVVTNDPFLGGQHLLDVQLFTPVIYDGQLVAFAANICHQLDMGGSVAGGVAGGLTEIFQEGLRLPFLKLYKAGQEDKEIFSIIESNIRLPDKTLADLRAQASALSVGLRRLKEMIAKYGVDVYQQCTNMLRTYTETKMRNFISTLPPGDYSAIDYLDDDGITDEPVKLQVNVHIKGDTMKVDFEGTDRQRPGNINCPSTNAQGSVYYIMQGIVDPYMPTNYGCFRPIEVDCGDGLIVSPRSPAAVTARSETQGKIPEALLKALAPIVPNRVTAGSHGQATTCNFIGIHPDTGRRFSYMEILGGGCAARPDKDGADGQDLHLGRFMNTPVEVAESEFPVTIERYEFMPNSGGAGRWRGGISLRRDIRFHVDVTFAHYSDRWKFAPQGLFGGKEGSKTIIYLNPGTPQEEIPKEKGVTKIKAGDLLSIRLAGSGGYGPPWEREPERVRWDVVNGKISLQSARDDYLVVLNSDLTVATEQTKTLRAGIAK